MMIQTFFRLTDLPFGKDIPPADLHPTEGFTELQHRLDYMRNRRGLMLVTGEPGTGKTAGVRAFVQKLNPSAYKVFYVPLSTVTPLDFYLLLNLEFGGESSARKSTLFKNLQKAIRDYVENAKRTPILILDEAQYLPNKTLDELPILLNFRMDSVDPMIMILIGHPQFAARLQRPPYRNIHQRILLQYEMPPMTEEACRSYVLHHLARVGGRENIFTEAALLAIYANSGGICRQVNRLCVAALSLGALEQKDSLSEEDIFRASAEI
jgi:type II secretory pathway predicted ATPase ExeA